MAIETELEAMTDVYFAKGGQAVQDLYTETSFCADYFLKEKKGNYDTHAGGRKIKIALRYDGNKAGFFQRGTPLDSTKTEAVTAVYLPWRYIYGNATMYHIDELENDGPEQLVDMLATQLEGGQIGMNKVIATSIFTGLEGDANNLTGFNAICDTTATTKYAEYCSNDIVSADGTKVWTGLGSSSTTILSMDAIGTIRTAAAYGEGKMAMPDLIATTEANFNTIKSILRISQLFTEGVKTAKYGFSGVHFEGCDIFPDRYIAASGLYAFNTKHVGFTVHPKSMFSRGPWHTIADSPEDRTMKILLAANLTCNNRRSCYRHSAIS